MLEDFVVEVMQEAARSGELLEFRLVISSQGDRDRPHNHHHYHHVPTYQGQPGQIRAGDEQRKSQDLWYPPRGLELKVTIVSFQIIVGKISMPQTLLFANQT